MRAYQVVGLVIVCSATASALGYKVGEGRALAKCASAIATGEDCCGPLPGGPQTKAAPKIPTGSGLPCLLVFGSGECQECKKANALLAEMAPRLKRHVDVMHLDPDDYPAETARWRVRIIPTQIIIGADGKEVERIERFVPEPELVAALAKARVKLSPAPKAADG
ncbi:MAG: thioredoxin family protein [Armatimonadetes bacterium]|nr:thioredoxin family protein [Armatimonadota bacterium]